MSILEYINCKQVSKINQHELQSITCRICLGVAFKPFMCGKCKNLFCQSHSIQFVGRHFLKDLESTKRSVLSKDPPCRCGDHITLEVDPKFKQILRNLRIKCECAYEPYTYSEYLRHKSKCSTHKFKQFSIVVDSKSAQKVNISDLDNASMNMNMIHKNYTFTLNQYLIFLKQLKAVFYLYSSFTNLKAPEDQAFTYNIKFVEESSLEKKTYWFYQGNDNPYEPYDERGQQELETKFKAYENGYSWAKQYNYKYGDKLYTINFSTMEQTLAGMKSNPRKVYRQTFV